MPKPTPETNKVREPDAYGRLSRSISWDAQLMLAVGELAAEQGRSFNEYLALVAARHVSLIERRRQRKNVPTPEAA